jgi:hypothetical protein
MTERKTAALGYTTHGKTAVLGYTTHETPGRLVAIDIWPYPGIVAEWKRTGYRVEWVTEAEALKRWRNAYASAAARPGRHDRDDVHEDVEPGAAS